MVKGASLKVQTDVSKIKSSSPTELKPIVYTEN